MTGTTRNFGVSSVGASPEPHRAEAGRLAALADRRASGAPDLAGKTVLLIHPAWHSCGSHQVFVSQARAYRSLGARVLSLAIADSPGAVQGSRAHKVYAAATPDLAADARFYSGMPLARVPRLAFLNAARLWLHGNFAAILVESTTLAPIPAALRAETKIDFIHCNHFFCMPAAMAMKQRHGAPVALDTHDLQARQYALRNESGWTVPPRAKFDAMLAIELAELGKADVLLHLNNEEAASFKMLLPSSRHELVYPATPPVAVGAGGPDFIIVASANYANFLGVVWFLEEVLPLAPNVAVKIIGNIDREFRARAPALFKRHAALFSGRIEDLDAAYANAAAVLLPTTEGHGISIKTIEALSSGAPLIATPHAFRGMQIEPAQLRNVALATEPARFAAALTRAHASRHAPAADRASSDTRRAYEAHFGFNAYRAALARVAASLLGL
ncbi:glycosyl transferase group 1 [Methylocella silvestris BL2]|uniref:Glycosyl transferase group 1 n=1 Tax=Methylocella silvestris (strain DSM 15510 / CIP 108128 / LMG 27833 / NCIMB 13906 / BL2) TaxID=395965 RepID=B8EJV6_METSB|nr:glycosyltransferase [Methylocella silvestris]ACK49903.1 glycosyl transferase group 1 [Methylocella silvestris BL2]